MSKSADAPLATGDNDALAGIRSLSVNEEAARVRSAGFRLLLETGSRVEPADLADAVGIDVARVRQAIAKATGRVEIDGDGRLLGIAGLTITPTSHEITIGDRRRWTWCALDAVGILGALESTGTIRSTDPRTGEEVRIEFVCGRAEGDATMFLLGGSGGGNVRQNWCPNVNFFATRESAQAWVADRDLNGDVVAVADIADEAATMWRPVVDPSSDQP